VDEMVILVTVLAYQEWIASGETRDVPAFYYVLPPLKKGIILNFG
jgi:hypothetical protein